MKKKPWDIIILHLHTTNDDHIMYGSWDTDHDRQKNVCHFRLFSALLLLKPRKSKFCKKEKNAWRYHHFTQVYHKCQSYDAWFLRYEVQQTNFFVILSHFLPFYHNNNPNNQNFDKLKKMPGYIIILHRCTKNHDHREYCSWYMAHDGLLFFILGYFLPFHHLNSPKNQNS